MDKVKATCAPTQRRIDSSAFVVKVSAKQTFDDPKGGTHVVTEVCHIAEGAFGAVSKAGPILIQCRVCCYSGQTITRLV